MALTDLKGNVPNQNIVAWLDLREVTVELIKSQGLHEGLYDLAVEFQVSIGAVAPDPKSPTSVYPGSVIGVKRIGLLQVAQVGPHTVNAAEVNPSTKQKANVK